MIYRVHLPPQNPDQTYQFGNVIGYVACCPRNNSKHIFDKLYESNLLNSDRDEVSLSTVNSLYPGTMGYLIKKRLGLDHIGRKVILYLDPVFALKEPKPKKDSWAHWSSTLDVSATPIYINQNYRWGQ